ncbi:MAG: elongation factor G [Candidatus Hydrogenedentota bacterium]
MKPSQASRVRNVALYGHSGAGKTTLMEHLLCRAGITKRLGRIEEGNTVGDYLPEEIEHQHTLSLKLSHFDWHDKRIHLIDHPGYADFLGEVAATAPIIDGAIIVVDATTGPRVGTDHAMRYCARYRIPHAIFVNKLDHDNADFGSVVHALQDAYGKECVPLVLPIGHGKDLDRVEHLIDGDFGDIAESVDDVKNSMMDVVAESDDELVEKYLEDGTLSHDDFEHGLQAGISSGHIVPIIAGSVNRDMGVEELMTLVSDEFPSPLERHVVCRNGSTDEVDVEVSPDGPFLAQVFRSVVDPFVGHLTFFRVMSGTLKTDTEFFNVSSNNKERSGKLFMLQGKVQTQVSEVIPGDIAAMTKLKHTHFGDTIAAIGTQLTLPAIELPDPMVKLAIEAKSRKDDDKIGEALHSLAEEDPTFKHYRDPDTHEHVIRGMGDLHLDIILSRLKSKYNVDAETRLPKVAYRETIKGTSDMQGKHKKQSGGHGQYGDVKIKFSPNARGEGYEFVDSVVGGVVPRQYIPHVNKGIQESLARGVIAGYPVVDVKAELHFGSYHDVDSSEMAFKVAASHAVQDGIKAAKPFLLEPILEIEVTVPIESMGDINGDLSSRRGKILGMEGVYGGKEMIRAAVPESEMLCYGTELKAISGGRGTYIAKFSHYEEVPEEAAKGLLK